MEYMAGKYSKFVWEKFLEPGKLPRVWVPREMGHELDQELYENYEKHGWCLEAKKLENRVLTYKTIGTP